MLYSIHWERMVNNVREMYRQQLRALHTHFGQRFLARISVI